MESQPDCRYKWMSSEYRPPKVWGGSPGFGRQGEPAEVTAEVYVLRSRGVAISTGVLHAAMGRSGLALGLQSDLY